MVFEFPEEFLFGAACSACQIESGCGENGKVKMWENIFINCILKSILARIQTNPRIFIIDIRRIFK